MVSQVMTIPSQPVADARDVLIVEDEQTSRRALSMLLSTAGYRTQAFATAEEALLWLNRRRRPHFALIDLDLPGMNGLDLIRRLEQLDPTVYPILITATDQESLSRRLADRTVAYLRKPIDFERLLRLMSIQQESH